MRGRTGGYYVPDAASASEQHTPLSLRPALLDDIEAARTRSLRHRARACARDTVEQVKKQDCIASEE